MPGVFRLQLLRKAGNDLSCDYFCPKEQTIVSERKKKTPVINYSPGAGDGGEGQRIFFFVTMKCTSKEN